MKFTVDDVEILLGFGKKLHTTFTKCIPKALTSQDVTFGDKLLYEVEFFSQNILENI